MQNQINKKEVCNKPPYMLWLIPTRLSISPAGEVVNMPLIPIPWNEEEEEEDFFNDEQYWS